MKKIILLFQALLIISCAYSQTSENNDNKQKEIKLNSGSSSSLNEKKQEIPNYSYHKEFASGSAGSSGKYKNIDSGVNQNPDLLKSSSIPEAQEIKSNQSLDFLFNSLAYSSVYDYFEVEVSETLNPPENLTGTVNAIEGYGLFQYIISLGWTAPSSDTPPISYNIYISETENGSFSLYHTTTESTYSFEFIPIETNSWWFYVTAVYDTGESAPSTKLNLIVDVPTLTIDGITTTAALAGQKDCWNCWYVVSNWYKFYAPSIESGDNTSYEILADGGLDLSMYLYKGDMTTLVDKDENKYPYYDAKLSVTNSTGEWYYIKVTASTTGNYNIGVKTLTEIPYKTLIVDKSYNAIYSITPKLVEYRFTTGIAGSYTIQTNGSLNTVLDLYDATGLVEQDDDDGENSNALIQINLAANTEYIIRMIASSNGNYSIIVNEPTMQLMVNGSCVSSFIVYFDDNDWYKFQTGYAGIYIIEQSVISFFSVSLYESDQSTLIATDEVFNNPPESQSNQQRIEQTLSANTWYYIKIRDTDYRPQTVINSPYCIAVQTETDIYPTYSEYLFEESSGATVFDTKGSNHGIIVNNTSRVNGVLGGGLQFTGTEYINLGKVFSENVQNEITLSAWIKPAITGIYQGIIMHGGPNVDTYGLYIRPDSKEIGFKTSGTSNSWYTIEDVNKLWDGNWHLVTVTYDGVRKIIYLDNEVIIDIDATGTIESGTGYNLLIGAGRDEEPPTLLYEGLIDEVRIYNYALNSTQINEIYNLVDIKPDCPQHFHTVWEGTLGQDHMNINVIEAKMDNLNLAVGDEIGIFDGTLCVGYGKVTEIIEIQTLLSIVVSRDDGSGNGFTQGNNITYKFWNCSDSLEYNVQHIQYYDNQLNQISPLTFDSGSTAFVALSGASEVCLSIRLQQGWNIFSVNNTPDSIDMETIFQPYIDNASLMKIQDEAGNSLEDWGIFGGWQNNIGDIDLTEGYKIKVNIEDSLEVCGTPVHFPYPIPLFTGWNIIGFPQFQQVDGEEVVQSLIDVGALVKVQDEAGNSIEDWGIFGGWQNNIGSFTPGEGYKVKVNADDTLWIYESYPKSTTIHPELIATTHFHPSFEGNGVDHMNINLVALPQNVLQAGDEVAVFDGEVCVGAVTLMPRHLNRQTVSVVASAMDDEGMLGFAKGTEFTLKLWKAQQNMEVTIEPEIVKGLAIFTKHESVVVSLEKYATTGLDGLQITGITEVKCYPNPFNAEITVEIKLAIDSEVKIEVMNQLGQSIKYITIPKLFSSGIHQLVWDGKNANNQQVSPGIYHLKINIDEVIFHRKIVYSEY